MKYSLHLPWANMFFHQGPFSSLEGFSKDFNCPKGSNYNPEKRCQVNLIPEHADNLIIWFLNMLIINLYLRCGEPTIALFIWSLFWQPLYFNKERRHCCSTISNMPVPRLWWYVHQEISLRTTKQFIIMCNWILQLWRQVQCTELSLSWAWDHNTSVD